MPNPNTPVPSWAEIRATQEYQLDNAYVFNILVGSLGTTVFTQQSAFLQLISELISIHRYYIKHLPDLKDIDKTPFFNYIAAEVGFDIPFLQNYSAVELIRESKKWYGLKGTSKAITGFAADLVGSAIEVDTPARLVFKFSNPNSCFSGAKNPGGIPLPLRVSKLARFQDNRFWTFFTYLVTILDGQAAVDKADLESILDNMNPAGMERYENWIYTAISDDDDLVQPSILGQADTISSYSQVQNPGISFDNGFRFNGQFNGVYGSNKGNPKSFFDTSFLTDPTLFTFSKRLTFSSKVYVSGGYALGWDQNYIIEIEPLTNTVKNYILIQNPDTHEGNPGSIWTNNAKTFAYCVDQYHLVVYVIDLSTNTMVDRILIPGGLVCNGQESISAISPDDSLLYICSTNSNQVMVVNLLTNSYSLAITVGSGPSGVVFNKEGTKAYVANVNDSTISVIDVATHSVSHTLSGVVFGPNQMAASPDGRFIAVNNQGGGSVGIFSQATEAALVGISAGSSVLSMAFSPDSSRLYVAQSAANNILDISTSTWAVQNTIHVAAGLQSLAFIDNNTVYATSFWVDQIQVIDVATHSITDTIHVTTGLNPDCVAPMYVGDPIPAIAPLWPSLGAHYSFGNDFEELAFDMNGDLWIADPATGGVWKVDATNGTHTFYALSGYGFPSGKIHAAPDGSFLWVLDERFHAGSIWKVALDGTAVMYSMTLTTPTPIDFCVDDSGNAWIVGQTNASPPYPYTIWKVTPGGVVTSYLPMLPDYNTPYSVVYDTATGFLYAGGIDDSSNIVIWKITTAGVVTNLVTLTGMYQHITNLTISTDGFLTAVGDLGDTWHVFTGSITVSTGAVDETGYFTGGLAPDKFNYSWAIDQPISPAGLLWRIGMDSTSTSFPITNGTNEVVPHSLVFNSTCQKLYVTGHDVITMDPALLVFDMTATPPAITYPLIPPPKTVPFSSYQVGWDNDSNGGYVLAVTDNYLYAAVAKPDYAQSVVIKIDKATGLVLAESVDLNAGNGLFLKPNPTDPSQLFVVTAQDGTAHCRIIMLDTSNLSVVHTTDTLKHDITGFDVSPDGSHIGVIFHNGITNLVYLMNTSTWSLTNWTGPGTTGASFCFDNDNAHLWITNHGNDQINKYDLTGGLISTHSTGLVTPDIDVLRMHPVSGYLCGGDSFNSEVFIFDPGIDVLLMHGAVARYISDIQFDPSFTGYPYAAYGMSNQTADVYNFDVSGTISTLDFADLGGGGPYNHVFSGLAIDNNGWLYTSGCPDSGGGDNSLIIETILGSGGGGA